MLFIYNYKFIFFLYYNITLNFINMSFLCSYKRNYIISFIAGWLCISYILFFLVYIIYGTTDAAYDKYNADGSVELSPVKGLWSLAFTVFFIIHIGIVGYYKNEDCRIEEQLKRRQEIEKMSSIWKNNALPGVQYATPVQQGFAQPNAQYATPVQQGFAQPDPNQPIAPVQNLAPI